MAATQEEVGSLRLALKEWAVAVRALERGDQVAVLRKGGIAEQGRRFEPRDAPFLLFPTREHQDPAAVRPRFRGLLEGTRPSPPGDAIPFSSWAAVARAFRVESEDALLAAAADTVWTDAEVRERWAWKPERPLVLLALRVFRLPSPVEVERKRQYGGCRSWVDLHEAVDVAGSRPVLDDDAFAARLDRVATQLGG